jgi:hypothetical protein
MAKAVADSKNPDASQGGFTSDYSQILGLSHMHDSGTGGVSSFSVPPKLTVNDLISASHPRWETSLSSLKQVTYVT